MQENLEAYVKGELNPRAIQTLFLKWISQAWEDVSAKKDMVVRKSKKCGIPVAIDGPEDSWRTEFSYMLFPLHVSQSPDKAWTVAVLCGI